MTWLLIASPLLAVLGILLIVLAQRVREARGLLSGETVALDGAGFLTDGGTVSVHRRDAAAPAAAPVTAKAPQDKPSAGNTGKP